LYAVYRSSQATQDAVSAVFLVSYAVMRLETGISADRFNVKIMYGILGSVQFACVSLLGFCVFFTGLSGSGKTTVANALVERLMEIQDRPITVLDGDHVRQMLSSGLGFSKSDRILNIKRIGYVASLVVKHGGIVIAAPIAPHAEARDWARECVKENGKGGFFETHLATPIETCESRDRKGLYKKARSGQLKGFTGIDDPYELPENPEIKINTATSSISQSVDTIVSDLVAEGFLDEEVLKMGGWQGMQTTSEVETDEPVAEPVARTMSY